MTSLFDSLTVARFKCIEQRVSNKSLIYSHQSHMGFWQMCDGFNSVTQSCPTLCDPMNCSTSGLPVHHQLPEFTQTHIHWVGDATQTSHSLSSLSPPSIWVFNLSQHTGLFKLATSLHQVAKVLEFQLQQQSFKWMFRTDFL